MIQDLLTPADVAKKFSVCEKTIRRWVATRKIRAIKPTSRVIRFRQADIEADIERMARKAI